MTLPVRCLEIRDVERARREMERIGVDPAGVRIMTPKQFLRNVRLEELTPAQANIIKQEMLSLGGEAAVSKGVVSCSVDSTDALLSGSKRHFERLTSKLRGQKLGLAEIAASIDAAISNYERRDFTIEGRDRAWRAGERTLVMAVLNVTPDSFSDGGEFADPAGAVARGIELARHADWVDVGGESTRPGAEPVSAEDELARVIPVVEGLARAGVAVSIDTTKAAVAGAALEAGAAIVNDVSAMTMDPEMAGVCARAGCPVVLMHMRGTPRTMQKDVAYDDLTAEVYRWLHDRVERAVEQGIDRSRIVIDPGLGFGKSAGGNLELIRNIGEFRSLGLPILVGVSRKSFIGRVTGDADPKGAGRLFGTMAAVALAAAGGACIVRVHDPAGARAVVDVADAVRAVGGEYPAL